MQKYYTPELEEFHIGFEYEQYENYDLPEKKSWHKYKLSLDLLNPERLTYPFPITSNIRVKYLDREDIEKLSWTGYKHSVDDWYRIDKIIYSKSEKRYSTFTLQHGYTDNTIIIYGCEYPSISSTQDETLYAGSCNNKSELNRLMVQLGIK